MGQSRLQEWEGQNGPIRIIEAKNQATEQEAVELFKLLVTALRWNQTEEEEI